LPHDKRGKLLIGRMPLGGQARVTGPSLSRSARRVPTPFRSWGWSIRTSACDAICRHFTRATSISSPSAQKKSPERPGNKIEAKQVKLLGGVTAAADIGEDVANRGWGRSNGATAWTCARTWQAWRRRSWLTPGSIRREDGACHHRGFGFDGAINGLPLPNRCEHETRMVHPFASPRWCQAFTHRGPAALIG
jgi:hypothetical protein